MRFQPIDIKMKKLFILVLTLTGLSVSSQTTADIFDYKGITFYGLDFTEAKCIGVSEFPAAQELTDYYFQTWNDVFMVGKKRLNIGKPYKKKQVVYDTMIFALNREMGTDDLIIDGSYSLKKSDIPDFTLKFADSKNPGIGLVYIVESLNANSEYLSVWITFFNNSTGEVLLTEPIRSKGKGRRFGDYWQDAFIRLYVNSAYDYKTWSKIYR